MVQFEGNAISSTLMAIAGRSTKAYEPSGDGLSHGDWRFTLTVTPQITVDGVVHSSVNPNVTHDTGVATSPSRVAVPVITVREADTVAHILLTPTLMAR